MALFEAVLPVNSLIPPIHHGRMARRYLECSFLTID